MKCASSVSEIACVSACVEMDGPIQMGDGCGEPSAPCKVILVTAPVPRDAAYEARLAFREWPSRASATRRPRGRLKCRRVSDDFGTRGFPCGRVCGASHAACRVFCSRNAWSGSTGRYARAGLHGKPCRFCVRMTSPGISQHEGRVNSARCPTWGIPRKRALIAMHRATLRMQLWSKERDEGDCKSPRWRCKVREALHRVHGPGQDVASILVWAKEH